MCPLGEAPNTPQILKNSHNAILYKLANLITLNEFESKYFFYSAKTTHPMTNFFNAKNKDNIDLHHFILVTSNYYAVPD